jgi:hypothetical protein
MGEAEFMQRIKWLVMLLGFALATGCGISGPSGCDICITSAVVYGTVRSSGGNALPAARITIEARAPSCRSDGIGGNSGSITTDSLGNYRGFVISDFAPGAVCLIVTAQPADSARFRITADTGHVVSLGSSDASQDSVRVDLVVPPVV